MVSIKELQTRGLLRVPYPAAVRQAVHTAARSWRQFCELPLERKTRLAYVDEGTRDGSGYECRGANGLSLDRKETFDVTLKALPGLELRAGSNDDQVMPAFIDGARDVVEIASPFIMRLASAIEREYGLAGLAEEVLAGQRDWFLRYLHYFDGAEAGTDIATAHVDKVGLTLHLYETRPGLEYLEFPGSTADEPHWRPMPVTHDETVVISGMQMQYQSDGRLKALCHRVRANAETAAVGRFSMVCFVPLLRTPAYNKAAFGRLQERPAGFNYGLPNDAFRRLFV